MNYELLYDSVDDLKAVIFDLDGTLVKSAHDFWRMKEAMIYYLVNLGLEKSPLSPQQTTNVLVQKMLDFLKTNGASDAEIAKNLTELNDLLDRFELESAEQTVMMEGARDVLRLLRCQGFKIGILTRSCEAYTIQALEQCKMREYVEEISARKDLLSAKPNPKAGFEICNLLGVDPRDAVLIGDHPMDLECAQLTGMHFIGILGGSSSEESLRAAGSKQIAERLIDLLEMLKPD